MKSRMPTNQPECLRVVIRTRNSVNFLSATILSAEEKIIEGKNLQKSDFCDLRKITEALR